LAFKRISVERKIEVIYRVVKGEKIQPRVIREVLSLKEIQRIGK